MPGSPETAPLFSVCTLVNDRAQYAVMLESFQAHGFTGGTAEFLHLDNTGGNAWDAYAGLTHMLDRARGRYVVLVHQDVRLIDDGAEALAARLAELEARAPDWGVAGNAGSTADGHLVVRISDPWGEDTGRGGAFPAQVVSFDENFLVVRAETGLRPSKALSGFHLYGTDLCLQAGVAGHSCWVIDFHVRHLSRGNVDANFLDGQVRLENHWGRLLGQPRRIRTPCTLLTLRAGLRGHALGKAWMARRRMRLALKHLAVLAGARRA